jgi:DNA repair exonuclease SbcCD nuclease subunit
MKVTGILLSDIHFGAGDPKRLYKELKDGVYKKAVQLKKKLKFIGILGDYFDRKLALNSDASRYALQFMHELIVFCEENEIKLRVIRGTMSHDLNQLDSFKHWEVDAPNFRVINKAEYEELLPDLNVLWMPEEYPENWKERYAEFFNLDDGAKYDFIFGHGTMEYESFKGQVYDSERPIKSAPVFSEKQFIQLAEYTFFGHIHRRSSYKNRVFYCGSYSREAFGEEEPKGFYVIDYDTDTCEGSATFNENTLAPTFNTIHIDDIRSEHDNDDAAVTAAIRGMKDECGKLRIIVDDTGSDSGAFVLKEHFSEADGIVVKAKKPAGPPRDRNDEYDEVFADGMDVKKSIRNFIKIRTNRIYSEDTISDTITPATGDLEDE